MSPSTTHRYVKTLRAVGLLEQNPTTRASIVRSPLSQSVAGERKSPSGRRRAAVVSDRS